MTNYTALKHKGQVQMGYRDILFEVWSEDKRYRIYADGSVEGFGEEALIFNMFPLLRDRAIRLYCEAKGIKSMLPTTRRSKSAKRGAGQGTNGKPHRKLAQSSAARGEK